jgi:PEP-CTERM motif-containing protein
LLPGVSAGGGGQLTKSGSGTLEVNRAPSFAVNSGINVSGGTLRFNIVGGGGTPLVGTGVTATISGQATLELAGSWAALSYATNHTKIVNNSTAAAGLLVSGVNQVVGGIDGSGVVQVIAGGHLSADHIIQSALVIGGASGNQALVTIAASDNQGNPPAVSAANGLAISNSLSANSFLADGTAGSPIVSSAGDFTAVSSRPSSIGGSLTASASRAGSGAVPEPSALLLALVGLVGVVALLRARRLRRTLAG